MMVIMFHQVWSLWIINQPPIITINHGPTNDHGASPSPIRKPPTNGWSPTDHPDQPMVPTATNRRAIPDPDVWYPWLGVAIAVSERGVHIHAGKKGCLWVDG